MNAHNYMNMKRKRYVKEKKLVTGKAAWGHLLKQPPGGSLPPAAEIMAKSYSNHYCEHLSHRRACWCTHRGHVKAH